MKLPRCVVLLGVALAVALGGCSVVYRPPYDWGMVGEDILELSLRTREVVADGDKGRLSVAQSKKFLLQSQAMADLIRLRSAGHEKRLACLDALDQQYRMLLARRKPLRSASTVELRAALDALVAVRPRQAVAVMETSVPTTSDDDDWAERERRRERERERQRERQKEKDDDDHKDKHKDDKDDDKKHKD